jgi:molybdopterin converting factor small subunit
MALVLLPGPLAALFPDGERRVNLDGATVGELLDRLDERWPGMRDRLCEDGPVARPYIRLFVDGDPADLATPVEARSVVHVLLAIAGGRS